MTLTQPLTSTATLTLTLTPSLTLHLDARATGVPAVDRVPRPCARGDRRAAHQGARPHRRATAPRRAGPAAQYRRVCRSYVASRDCEALHDRPGLGDRVRRDPRRDEDPADDQATALRAR